MYDNICKFIVEEFSEDIATWLLGEPIELVELSPKELSLEPIRADSLILRQSNNIVLHAEFQTNTDVDMPFRMADYRLRVHRRYPNKTMTQVVIYLRKTASELVYQDTFSLEKTTHQFNVIRLWEQPTELFFSSNGLLPFAVLSQTDKKLETLQNVANELQTINNSRVQANLSASTAILSGLVLEEKDIQRILRSDIMKESTMYQAILREGKEEGMQAGIQEGIKEGVEKVARNMLKNGLNIELIAQLTDLSVEQVQQLQATQQE
ncbi:MAG: Rpn family recombination-promoting nuclease/putative transposase [Crocosphaera sp.]|nr:Rpn family recombination-promoting nuclease/putative transposase [Crocosphaera sp.]